MASRRNAKHTRAREEQYLEYFQANASQPRRVTLDIARSPLVLLSYSATQYVQTTSAIFRKQFGIGTAAWRLLVVLFRNPQSSSKEVARYIRMDKAAVSRALRSLMDQGYVDCAGDPEDERIKVWSLTLIGEDLHNSMLGLSTQIYEKVLSGLDDEEINSLRQCLQVLIRRIDQLPEMLPERLLNE